MTDRMEARANRASEVLRAVARSKGGKPKGNSLVKQTSLQDALEEMQIHRDTAHQWQRVAKEGLDRRGILRLCAAFIAGGWFGKWLYEKPDGDPPEGRIYPVDLFKPLSVEAADLARMEVTANRQRYPHVWPVLCYDGAIQFSNECIAWYGFGPPHATAERRERLCQWLDTDVLDVATSDCGRGWCVVSRGVLSDGCRFELNAAWAERERGQRLMEIHVRRQRHRERLERLAADRAEGTGV